MFPLGKVRKAGLACALRQRKSGIDPYVQARVSLSTLSEICAVSMLSYPSDAGHIDRHEQHVMLACVANRVNDLPSGVYAYDAAGHRLLGIKEGNCEERIQSTYLLGNVNLAAAAAVFYVLGDYKERLSIDGNRGFRLLNLEAGLVALRLQTAAMRESLGVHMLLGFSVDGTRSILQLTQSNLTPLLMIAVGTPNHNAASITLPLWI